MADNIIQIEVEVDGKKGFASFNADAVRQANLIGTNVADNLSGKLTSGLSSSLVPGFRAIAATAAAAFAGAFTLKSAISEAVESENALNRLNVALASSGRFSQAASQSFQDFADRLQNTTKVSDDQVIALSALATNFARTNEQAQNLVRAAINLGAATGVDASTAVETLGRSLNGVGTTLGRTVPGIEKFTAEQLKAGAAVDYVNNRFGAAGTGEINTFSGALTQLTNKFSNFLEEIGNIVVKSPAVIATLKTLGALFVEMGNSIKTSFAGQDIFKPIILGAVEVGKVLNDFVLKPITTLGNISEFVFNMMASGIAQILNLFARFNLAVSELQAKFKLVPEDQVVKAQQLVLATGQVLDDYSQKAVDAFNRIGQTPFADNVASGLNRIAVAADAATASTQNLTNAIRATQPVVEESIPFATAFGEEWKKQTQASGAFVKQFVSTVRNGILNGISSSFAALGKALVTGQNGFEAFGKAVLGALGSMAIQIGTMLVSIGIGFQALGPILPPFGLSGAAAVVAGLGLIVLGGALTALGGEGGGAVGPAPNVAGAGGAAGSPTATDLGTGLPTTAPELAASEPKTVVTVNVQGNILDRRESGLEIINVLNDYFDTNDGVLART